LSPSNQKNWGSRHEIGPNFSGRKMRGKRRAPTATARHSPSARAHTDKNRGNLLSTFFSRSKKSLLRVQPKYLGSSRNLNLATCSAQALLAQFDKRARSRRLRSNPGCVGRPFGCVARYRGAPCACLRVCVCACVRVCMCMCAFV